MSNQTTPPGPVSTRVLVVLALALVAVLLCTVLVAIVVRHTPALRPIDVPSVGRA